MNLVFKGHNYEYELVMLLKLFYPSESFHVVDYIAFDDNTLLTVIDESIFSVYYYEHGVLLMDKVVTFSNGDYGHDKHKKKVLKKAVYDVFCDLTQSSLPWGMLTGIRPTKIVFELMKKYKGDNGLIKTELKRDYGIANSKIDLMLDIVETEMKILNKNKENQVSIYIGIPFCPTRCLYCSFTAYPIHRFKHRIEEYLSALSQEMTFVSNELLRKNKEVRTLYVGGGTPTTLDETELEQLMRRVHQYFDFNTIEEFTVEAGRPDTITKKKLEILKDYGVDRVAINPQTMNQRTLDIIGRKHTVEDIIRTYHLAREVGLDAINMDMIVGLPGETMDDVSHTIQEIKKLDPDNLTVHTLAVKRASRLKENEERYVLQTKEHIEQMLDMVHANTKGMGLKPYYMYRQKNMLGNFENVGYAKQGKACIYNIEIMEEKQTIWALGAGAVSKVVFLNDNRIERIENVKNVEHYMLRIDEMIERKKKFWR